MSINLNEAGACFSPQIQGAVATVRGFEWAVVAQLRAKLEEQGFCVRFLDQHGGSDGSIIEALFFDEHESLEEPQSLATELAAIGNGKVTIVTYCERGHFEA